MKRPTFEQTVNVLVQAYLRNELEHRVCTACAVGNIVAHALGTKPKRCTDPDAKTIHENYLFENGNLMSWWNNDIGCHRPTAQSEATGYTIDELNRIELAFEFAEGQPDSDGFNSELTMNEEWMFNGLMAVVDVLAEIHNVDLSVKENAKALFVKP
jgi:hypothetical protein